NGDRIGQGKENARQYLIDNPEVAREIEQGIRAKLLPVAVVETDEPEAVKQA
ncbi:MAG: DNA recombination/repair protein RecA, partial [Gammaproteobacteria bacterium]